MSKRVTAASRFEEPAGRSRRHFGGTKKSLGFRGADFEKKTASETKKTPKIEYTFSVQIFIWTKKLYMMYI